MEDIKTKKKKFMDFLGVAILGLINSDPEYKQEIKKIIDSIYDIIKGLNHIIINQKSNKKNIKLLEKQQKILIEISKIVHIYNNKNKGNLINLWNELDKLYKQEL